MVFLALGSLSGQLCISEIIPQLPIPLHKGKRNMWNIYNYQLPTVLNVGSYFLFVFQMTIIPDDGKKPKCKTEIAADTNNPLYDEKFSL